MAQIAYMVNIPETLIQNVLEIISQFCGPTVQMGEWVQGQKAHPTVEMDNQPIGHFADQGPLGIRFWTSIQDLALRIEGFIEAQEDPGKE